MRRREGRRGRGPREGDLDPAERRRRRQLRRAHRRANQRIAFLTHLVSFVAVLTVLLVATRSVRLVTLLGLAWGVGVFIHYLWAVAAPRLRDRWVEQEVGQRSARDVASQRRAVETRSLRRVEDLSASIAHEIRNPITAAKSLVQQMGEDPASRENLEYAGLALSELDRVERSISHLLRYARDEEPRLERLDLRRVAEAATAGLRDRAESAGVELVFDFDQPVGIRGDAEKLRRVIENLVSNAIDAVVEAGGREPRVEVLGGRSLAGDEVWLRIVDNGPGIPPEERPRIWSPFYTTKEEGTGLGLALSRKTIEAHGGSIELEPQLGSGSEFVVTLPADSVAPGSGGAEQEGAYDGR